MAIKFEALEPGMVLLDIHSERAGNTTARRLGCWRVKIISIDFANRTATASWNGNPPRIWYEHNLKKLYREGKEPKAYCAQQERRLKGGLL